MDLSQIRQQAAHRLREDGDSFRKLVLIHSTITAGISLLLMLIIRLLQSMTPEGGLSNMGTQTMLETGQALLQLANMIAIPFWNGGLVFCTLRVIREHDHSPIALAEGFRRWVPISSSLLFRGIIYFFVTMACSFASSIILSTLPITPTLLDALTAFMENPVFPLSGPVLIFMVVYLVIYLACIFVLLVPKLYLHRLVPYCIMDSDSCKGLQAVAHSTMTMNGKRKKLLLLDLSFWWFYLLEFGISILSMADLILPVLETAIPYADWIFPIIALLLQLILYYFGKPKLAISYALFYLQALEESHKDPEPTQPKRMPWKY